MLSQALLLVFEFTLESQCGQLIVGNVTPGLTVLNDIILVYFSKNQHELYSGGKLVLRNGITMLAVIKSLWFW